MRRDGGTRGLIRAGVTATMLCFAMAVCAQPTVDTVEITTNDAPVVQTMRHAQASRNVLVKSWLIAPSPDGKGEAVYALSEPLNAERGDPSATPVMFWVDLQTGKLNEMFQLARRGTVKVGGSVRAPGSVSRAATAPEMDDLMGLESAPAPRKLVKNWEWSHPSCWNVGQDGRVYFGVPSGEIVRFDPKGGGFEQVFKIPGYPMAVVAARVGKELNVSVIGSNAVADREGGVTRVPNAPIRLHRHDTMFGVESFPDAIMQAQTIESAAAGDDGWIYAVVGPKPHKLVAIRADGGKVQTQQLLRDTSIESAILEQVGSAVTARLKVKGDAAERIIALQAGAATDGPAQTAAQARGYDVTVNFDLSPVHIWIDKPGEPRRKLTFQYSKATQDVIKSMILSADGGKLYGHCYPNASVFEYELGDDKLLRRGQHYVFYQWMPDGEAFYMVGYSGIKLMRWDPREPWTMDESRHINPRGTAWVLEEPSNPQLICRLRYLRHLNIRRPAAIARGADGRIYTGARDMGINLSWANNGYDNVQPVRYSGVMFWYDPKEQMIGYEAEDQDFEHLGFHDLCSVNQDRYIAMVTGMRGGESPPSPFDPRPADFKGGYLHIWDTQAKRFVHRSSPLNGRISYIAEAEPGILVGFGDGYEGSQGALFIFDTNAMRTTRIIRLPLRCRFTTYGSPVRFERGPDNRIYFYGTDANGAAMFRVDSVSGKVEAVARGTGITTQDEGAHPLVYLPGNTFVFGKDKVYFGSAFIYSTPIENIIGGASGGKP